MEPTNQLRWIKRKVVHRLSYDEECEVVREAVVLQQLWVEAVDIRNNPRPVLTYPGRQEWRDVPTEGGEG